MEDAHRDIVSRVNSCADWASDLLTLDLALSKYPKVIRVNVEVPLKHFEGFQQELVKQETKEYR